MTRTETVEVIIPVYNEARNLEKLYSEIARELGDASISFTLLFVDDGSTDRTPQILERLHAADARVRFISLTRNFGQQIALIAGLEHATGNCVITMDGDLQHPPHLIPDMIGRWREGYQVVSTTRELGTSVGLFKRAAIRVFYTIFNSLSGLRVPVGTADFRLLDGEAVRTLMAFPERTKFLRGLVDWAGLRTSVLPYTARAREGGGSRYSLARRLAFVWDGLTAFSTAPLRLPLYLGLAALTGGAAYGGVLVSAALREPARPITTWEVVLAALLILGSLQLVSVGLLGAYVAKILDETKGRPLYMVKKRTL